MSFTEGSCIKPTISIIGFGAAGMLCFRSLQLQGLLDNYNLQIFEPDSKTANDRTWCFWITEDDPILQDFSSIIHRSWSDILVGTQRKALTPLQYVQINSKDFYAFIKQGLDHAGDVKWIKDTVVSVDDTDGQKVILTNNGKYLSDIVLDSRVETFDPSEGQLLLQSFYGWKVKILKHNIDSSSVQLMNFEIDQDQGCQFIYVLPDSDSTALVEVTRFGTDLIQKARAEEIMDEWLKKEWGVYEIEDEEHGIIPMTQSLDNNSSNLSPSYIKIGTAGGAVKASTGFAFHTMYQHAASITHAIKTKSPLPGIKRKGRFQFYDSLLIFILIHFPQYGKSIFEALFRRVKPATILQFLSEKTTLIKEIPLLLSLPYSPFFKALFQLYLIVPFQKWSAINIPIYECSLVVTMLVFTVLYPYYPQQIELSGYALLIGGLIFPGIPHGALDHYLEGHLKPTGIQFWRFILQYLAVMMLVLVIWWIAPTLGLLTFLVYSAWHFGETDIRHLNAYSPGVATLYGGSLLVFLLGSHPQEASFYFEQLGAYGWTDFILAYSIPLMVCSSISILGLFWCKGVKSIQAGLLLILLLLATQLPLVIAFGFYFIGYHSVRAWKDIRQGLQTSSFQMFKFALPYSLGAYAFFFVAWYWLRLTQNNLQDWIPALFLFLAAISAPHIMMMHRFYTKWGLGKLKAFSKNP